MTYTQLGAERRGRRSLLAVFEEVDHSAAQSRPERADNRVPDGPFSGIFSCHPESFDGCASVLVAPDALQYRHDDVANVPPVVVIAQARESADLSRSKIGFGR
jgi:hypothetical protein